MRNEDLRFPTLVTLVSLLDNLGVDYRISTGTLLGFVRDSGFIPWDWDVGVDLPAEQLLKKWEVLIRELEAEGFSIEAKEKTFLNAKIACVKNGVEFEVMGWRRDMFGGRRRRRLFIPGNIWPGGGVVEVHGMRFRTYKFPECYLEHFYGDWRTPIKASTDSEKSTYMTRSVRRRDFLDSILFFPQWFFVKARNYFLRGWFS